MRKSISDIRRGKKANITLPSVQGGVSVREVMHNVRRPVSRALDIGRKKRRRSAFIFPRTITFCLAFFVLAAGLFFLKGALADKDYLEKVGKKAAEYFLTGVEAFVAQEFDVAGESFARSAEAVTFLQDALAPLDRKGHTFESEPDSIRRALQVAQEAALAGERISVMAPELEALPDKMFSGGGEGVLHALNRVEGELLFLRELVRESGDLVREGGVLFQSLALTDNLSLFEEKIPEIEAALNTALDLLPAIEVFLGKGELHTAAVFFQNTGEIRASGGFPGSLALLESRRGEVMAEFFDIYFFGWKNKADFPPPEGFERLTDRLFLRDANSFFHFPASAAQMRTMLEYSEGPSADTIITISDDLFREILLLTGPVSIPGTAERLTAENASTVLSFFVEAKAFGRHTPKEVMKQLIPELQEKMRKVPATELIGLYRQAVHHKWVLAHSRDPVLQQAFHDLGISGEVKAPPVADYLAVVSANVGGNKSDHFVRESVDVVSVVALSGEITNTVTVEREHAWGEAEEELVKSLLEQYGNFHVEPETLRAILGSGENHSYTQVFVPFGSELLAIENVPLETVAISEQAGKTVFGFRFPKLAAGGTQSVRLRYRLPERTTFPASHHLYYQTQPGRDRVQVMRRVLPEAGLSLKDSGRAQAELDADGLFLAEITK